MSGKDEQSNPASDQYSHGLAEYRQGRYAEAMTELEPLCAQKGLIGRLAGFYQAMSHRAMGIEALREGEFCQAETHLRAAMDTIGRCGDLASYLASAYAGIRCYRRCAEEMEKAVDLEADDVAAWRKSALAKWQAGRRPEAYMTLSEAIRKLGDRCELHLQLGLFYAAEQQYEQANASLTSAVEADCTNSEAHYYLALAAAAHGDMPAAVRSFQRAFELRPADLMAAYQLALAAKAAGEEGLKVNLRLPELVAESAGSEMRQLARYVCQEPDFLGVFVSLPESEVDEELFGLLAGVLQMAIDEHPDYADLHYHCSRVLRRMGRMDGAIDHANRALAINPSYVDALVHAGRLYEESRRPREAIERLERAIACGGDWVDVHCLLGEQMRLVDRPRDAQVHLRRALELDAGYRRAADALASLAA